MLKNLFKSRKPKTLKTKLLKYVRSHKLVLYPDDLLRVVDQNNNTIIELRKFTKFDNGPMHAEYFAKRLKLRYSMYFEDEADLKKWVAYRLLLERYNATSAFGTENKPYSGTEELGDYVHRTLHYYKHYRRLRNKNIFKGEEPVNTLRM